MQRKWNQTILKEVYINIWNRNRINTHFCIYKQWICYTDTWYTQYHHQEVKIYRKIFFLQIYFSIFVNSKIYTRRYIELREGIIRGIIIIIIKGNRGIFVL